MNSINTYSRQLKSRIIVLIVVAVAVLFTVVSCGGQTQKKTGNISPEVMVDYIYKVIQAHQTVYSQKIVNRLDNQDNVIQASENWEEDKALILPAQMLRLAAESVSKDGSFTYGLISPWNINDAQAPKSEFEKKAMNKVIETGLPSKSYQKIAGKQYLLAIYPSKAVSQACINCHNNHPVHKQRYPDKVFKLGDVMGGIYINLPLEDG
ncbi:MAG: DUF3365 domain-containing protein [Xenococcaceae cyanobacterium]